VDILKISNLHKHYSQGGNDIPVLEGLELSVGKGETVSIIGKSGTGKSTLLSLMSGLDKPDKGSISISGVDIVGSSEAHLGRFRGENLGIVFQQFHLMSALTALENVALPLEIIGDSNAVLRAQEALDMVGLGHRFHHRPSQLSGGECQRVAIARAFVGRPALLLADEPSGNLDEDTGVEVLDQLFQMVADTSMTMVLVTHNTELAKRCSRTLTLAKGRLNDL